MSQPAATAPAQLPCAVPLLLFFCIAAQAALTYSCAVTLHYELKTSGLDGTVYEQLMRNVLDGHGFTSSINPPFQPQHWLGFHFSPILYLLVPLYALYPHIETLLATGSLCVALAAWPIYLTASTILGNASQAWLIAMLYLICPFVINGTFWDFHEVDLAPLTIAWMLWAVVHKKRGLLLALSVVLLCIKEHYGLSVAGFGLLWWWQWRERKFGLGMAAFGLIAFWLVLCVIMPHFNPGGRLAMMNTSSMQDRFSWLTHTNTLQSHAIPMLRDALSYGMNLLLPLLLLPLGAPVWLLPALADGAADILSGEMMMRSVLSYHSIALIPVLLIATCQSIRRWCHGRTRFKSNDAMLGITAASACYAYMMLALPFTGIGNMWEISELRFGYKDPDRKAVDDINALIPKDAAVSAQMNVLPHLAVRSLMYPYPLSPGDAAYIVLNLHFPFKRALSLFGIPYNPHSHYFSEVTSILHNEHWGVVYYSSLWVVLRKDAPDNAQAHQQAMQALENLQKEYREVKQAMKTSSRRP